MAQYYHPGRASSSSVTSDSCLSSISPRDAFHRYPNAENSMASSSILVFPNPPSAHETSRNESRFEFSGSTPSLPTDMSLDSSQSRNGGGSQDRQSGYGRSWHDKPGAFLQHPDERVSEEEWELDLDRESSRSGLGGTGYNNHSRKWDHVHTRTPSSLTSLSGASSSLMPQPPFHLPFLPCLQMFLDLDESTLHLLSRSPNPHTSALFPSSPGPPSTDIEYHEEEPAHGLHKLLLDSSDKPKNGPLINTVLDPYEFPSRGNPFMVNPRIPVWEFLESVLEGGLRAWKEVQVWRTMGEPKLIGV